MIAQQIIDNPLSSNSITEIFHNVLDSVVQVVIPLVVLALVYLGMMIVYYGATGNTDKLSGAKTMVFWVLIGAFIVLSSKWILDVISNTYERARAGAFNNNIEEVVDNDFV